jgi:hypothetical protein
MGAVNGSYRGIKCGRSRKAKGIWRAGYVATLHRIQGAVCQGYELR